MPPDSVEEGRREIGAFREELREVKGEVRHLLDVLNDLKVGQARQDERQSETTRKLDNMTLVLANNYVGMPEFGDMKKRVDKLEGWNTWIIRLLVGAVILAGLAALRIKGGV